jgi:hypothetical protein
MAVSPAERSVVRAIDLQRDKALHFLLPCAGKVPPRSEDWLWQLWRYLYRCVPVIDVPSHSFFMDHPPCRQCYSPGAVVRFLAGTHLLTGEEVGIKLESTKTKHPQLLYESKIYKILQGGSECTHTLILGITIYEIACLSRLLYSFEYRQSLTILLSILSPCCSWHPKHPLVWRRRRLQRHGHRPVGPFAGGSV